MDDRRLLGAAVGLERIAKVLAEADGVGARADPALRRRHLHVHEFPPDRGERREARARADRRVARAVARALGGGALGGVGVPGDVARRVDPRLHPRLDAEPAQLVLNSIVVPPQLGRRHAAAPRCC